jgi:hypothetical protein
MADFFDLHDDPSARRILYIGAILLIAVPFLQALSQIWPLQLSNIQWRFGAANALSSILLLPYFGLLVLLLMSRALESRSLARLVGLLSALLTLGLMASLTLFVLDAQELKAIVSSQMLAAFNNTTVRVGLVTALFTVAFAYLTIVSFKSPTSSGASARRPARAPRTTAAKDSDEDMGLIVGLREN